jgi:hypothetical protein
MKKISFVLVACSFVLFSVGALATEDYMPDLKKQLHDTFSSITTGSTDTNPVEEIEPITIETIPIDNSIAIPERVITKEYDKHLIAGENNGFGLIENETHFKKLVETQKLVLVTKGAGYLVDELKHSYPYVTPNSKAILEELGIAFQSLSKDQSFFTVSSVTRTPEQQSSLRKRNRNATNGTSSHSYGASFDISYIRFNGKKGPNQKAQKNLEKVLNEFQDDNKLFFIKERQQSCYHITIR